MKPEDKQLLLHDLCARLPYGVKVLEDIDGQFDGGAISVLESYLGNYFFVTKGSLSPLSIEEVKPYLRPMSSMTEEEHNEWFNYYHEIELKEAKSTGDYLKAAILGESASIDWLNKNMFDYRGLIEKGFAIEVTKDNNPYKD